MPILLSLVYHLQKNMIISPIELCNPSVADPEGAAPSLQYPTNSGFCMVQKAPFQALDFDIFWRSMTSNPCKAHKRMTEPAVVCIRNYSKQIGFICWIHHCPSHEMSATLCQELCQLLFAKSYVYLYVYCKQIINSRCSCARRQMGST